VRAWPPWVRAGASRLGRGDAVDPGRHGRCVSPPSGPFDAFLWAQARVALGACAHVSTWSDDLPVPG
jgi:hypothetical protein